MMIYSSYRILVDLKNIVKRFAGSKYSAKQIRRTLKSSVRIRLVRHKAAVWLRYVLQGEEGRYEVHNNYGRGVRAT